MLLLLLLLVRDAACFGLQVSDLAEVEPNESGAERVGLGLAAVFLERGAEATDESIKATPSLAEGAVARAGDPEQVTLSRVDPRLAELVEVPEEPDNKLPSAL